MSGYYHILMKASPLILNTRFPLPAEEGSMCQNVDFPYRNLSPSPQGTENIKTFDLLIRCEGGDLRLNNLLRHVSFGSDDPKFLLDIPESVDRLEYFKKCVVDLARGMAYLHDIREPLKYMALSAIARVKHEEGYVFSWPMYYPTKSSPAGRQNVLFRIEDSDSIDGNVKGFGLLLVELGNYIATKTIANQPILDDSQLAAFRQFIGPIHFACTHFDVKRRISSDMLHLYLTMSSVICANRDYANKREQSLGATSTQTTEQQSVTHHNVTTLLDHFNVQEALDVIPFTLPPPTPATIASNKTTLGLLALRNGNDSLNQEELNQIKQHVRRSGLDNNYYPLSNKELLVACKTQYVNLTDEFIQSRFLAFREELLQHRHPNIVRYIDASYQKEKGQVNLLMNLFNSASLDVWQKKFEGSLTQQMMVKFARDVGAQLLLGLSYLHKVRNTFHGNVNPTNVLLDNTGRVALNDFEVTRLICGASPVAPNDLLKAQKEDIWAVARIMFSIASGQAWHLTRNLEPNLVTERAIVNLIPDPKQDMPQDQVNAYAPGLRNFLREVLSNNSSRTAADWLNHVCFSDLGISENVTEELEQYGRLQADLTMTVRQHGVLREQFDECQQNRINRAMIFLKSVLIPMLHHRKAVASSVSEWTCFEHVTQNVDFVLFGESVRMRFKLSSDTEYGIVKSLELKPDEASAHALRRAVTIMERSHHPNIVRMLAATRQGNQVHVICEVADLGSLRRVLQAGTIPRHSIVELLFGVACQVLSALLFLHSKLNVFHRDLNADHVLLTSDGRVKLCGFGASGKMASRVPTDMNQLATMLLELAPNDTAPDAVSLRDFAKKIALSDPYTALKMPEMEQLYNDTGVEGDEMSKLKADLKNLKISGTNPVGEMVAWRAYDEKNPTCETRHSIRGKMKELAVRREIGAIGAVRHVVQYARSQFAAAIEDAIKAYAVAPAPAPATTFAMFAALGTQAATAPAPAPAHPHP